MTKKSDAPAIRFKGFSDAWEQRKLSEITDKATEKNAGLQYVETFTNSAEFGIISQRDFFDHDIAKLGSLDGYYIVKTEDFVYNPRISTSAPVGPINRNKLGRTGVMSPLYTVFRPHDIDTTYLEYFFKCGYWHSFMNFNGDSGARSDRFSIRDNVFFQMPIPIPDIDEQRKIGELLTCLDNLITLHQRKFEKLTNVKKSMLEKMFPQNGSSYPEIRFKGFTDPWEQRKVSDLAEKTYGGGTPTTSNEAYWNGDIPWIQSSDVVDGKLLGVEPRKWITQDGLNNSAAQLIPGNSIAIITRVGVGKLAFMPYSYATSQDFLSLSKLNAEPLFTVYACYKKLQSELNAVQGTSIKGITKDELLAKNIMVPRYAEQQQIGAFFKQLDNLITLHQRECISFTARAGRRILTANKKRNTSSWEQRKLGEIGSVSMCRRIFKEQTSETGDIPFYKIGTFGADPDAFISRELFEEYKSKYPYPQKGDILISASGSIGRAVEFAGNNEYFQDSNIVWLNHDERLSNPFLKCFYSVVKWAGIEGSTIKRLYNDNILNTVICMPSVPEQKRIGLFFENLDNLITLHQRELEKLQNIKKSMLEKMFV